MKKLCLMLSFIAFTSITVNAQKAIIRRNIEKDMEKKYGEPQRKKGKEELDKITYENDKRYADPTNKTEATLVFENTYFDKKGNVKEVNIDKIIFGKTGECMVMKQGDKDEVWWVYDYKGKANYMVTIRDKAAIKMPLINMQKMAEKMAKKEMEDAEQDPSQGWEVTDEYKTINGFNCRKFIYKYPSNPHYSSYEAWVSNDVKFDLSGNYVFGARLSSYKFPEDDKYKDMINGFMVRSILYNKKNTIVSQRDLKSIDKSADEKYFDMSAFKINDVLDMLGSD